MTCNRFKYIVWIYAWLFLMLYASSNDSSFISRCLIVFRSNSDQATVQMEWTGVAPILQTHHKVTLARQIKLHFFSRILVTKRRKAFKNSKSLWTNVKSRVVTFNRCGERHDGGFVPKRSKHYSRHLSDEYWILNIDSEPIYEISLHSDWWHTYTTDIGWRRAFGRWTFVTYFTWSGRE